ncbi:PIG-L family deacetylase [Phycicoccus endophyticus]|uniref:PIG-L family deacetylase n=1 Tax=Phycicoccus endophyticus TaxID=1690220 RepID=A0A7G9QZ08_9MICO|nr:PIG-L family deacetylase [Phycicoccus endophyticus]NHI18922.1 N-acetyl-1-D-myo-inositol-2-amino-2-deoxy-alpha-D-glucopyranoside deacetylase [Phycicoccus endophyticus]QNN48583.1 PIG-L family deacetylase [Phycicoccus endophyticus]GGL31402.1 1D-myo-inositol 2-acetamido-2-deoxy-alpha-D-glucopyranoside deacetylase [Phycicoccus endophyticus]
MRALLEGLRPAGRPARLLFVHAHPDDETLTTGVALAHHARAGDDVHVLTCTLGEEGEVIPPALAHLEGDRPALAAHRRRELAAAMAVLGVTSHVLGEDHPGDGFRDSGMAGSQAARHPRAWAGVPLGVAAEAVGAVVADLRPDAVVTYDPHGGYGHPDHVRTHEAARSALVVVAPGTPLLATLTPRSWAEEDRTWLAEHVPAGEGWVVPGEESAYAGDVVPDEVVTRGVVDPAVVPLQESALHAHATQVLVGRGWYALSNRHVFRLAGREGYARLDPATGRPAPEDET